MAETDTAGAQPSAIDPDNHPIQYWDPAAPPDEVEVAFVNWNGVRTYHLLAFPDEGKIAYRWRIDGDSETYPEDPEPTEKPLTLDELFTLLEDNCLAASSLEESWDMAWTAAQDNLDYSDADAMEYALDEVSEAYTFESDLYATLSDLYDERFQAWREQQDVTVEQPEQETSSALLE